MNLTQYDLAPEDELNRILWYTARPDEPYLTPVHRAPFTTALPCRYPTVGDIADGLLCGPRPLRS
jgi:hypothetical protein